MTYKELQSIHREIESLVKENSIYEAIRKLKVLIRSHKIMDMVSKLENIESSYQSMLEYISQGYNDPNRNAFVNGIIRDVLKINDLAIYKILEPSYSNQYFIKRRFIKESYSSLFNIYEELNSKLNNLDIIRMLPENEQDINVVSDLCKDRDRLIDNCFCYIWTSPELLNNDFETIKKILSSNIPQYIPKHIISALYLSLLSIYDEEKLKLLVDIYNLENRELSVRAFIAVYALSFVYDYRISLSSSLIKMIELMEMNENYDSDLKMIMLQHIKSLNTERINKKMNEELIPELMKISPDIYKQLKNKKFSIEEGLDANPEWSKLIEKSDVTSKLQELNEMQIDGGDVFMSTFSHMKNYGFFSKISNWFLPFHADNAEIYDNSKIKLLDSINNSYYLCDSDKYSFALTIQMLPRAESEIMLSQINEQNIGIKELKTAELNTNNAKIEREIRSNIQDLYRYFKLNNKNLEYPDLFDFIPYINKSVIVKSSIVSEQIILDFLLKHNFYQEAIKILNIRISKGNFEAKDYEKIGFCYQNIKDYKSALENFKKAEFLEPENLWLVKHLAQCYKSTGDLKTAELYYLKVFNNNPDNISLLNVLGNICLEQNKLEESLKYYYKADYLSNGTPKFRRPIAWVEFMLSSYDKALNYYNKILAEETPTNTDYLNIGHLYWALGNINEAIKYYSKSYIAYGHDYSSFKSDFKNDLGILKDKGVDISLFSLILDKSCYYAVEQ